MKCKTLYFIVIVMMTSLWSVTVQAQLPGNISIHGFGGWAYGKTDNENRYLVGNEDGDYDNVNFSLNISAHPYEKFSVYFQGAYNEGSFYEGSSKNEAVLDYAFAEWYFSDVLILRAGKVKAPFMIYTEIFDVGTLRPFYALPQGVYGQLAAEAYKGLGITGSLYSSGGWGIMYDLYGGKLDLLPNRFVDLETFTFNAFTPVVNDMIGGRLVLNTPLAGLNLGLSSYTGDVEFELAEGGVSDILPKDRYTLIGISIEYLSDHWWIRSEYLTQQESPDIEANVAYVEVAYKLIEHLQLAARYEFADFEMPSVKDLIPESFLKHEDIALGLNYWFNPSLVFKLSYHIVDGNRFANPEKLEDFLAAVQKGGFDESTNLISFGVQFSF